MVDYCKLDKLELSDDSDIEVHPNVDKRSFIRAKQNQIHAERHQRKLQIEALKYERILQYIQDLQKDVIKKLDGLQKENTMKITSESYHTGFDSSNINKATANEKSKEAPKLELLNPRYDLHNAADDIGLTITEGLSQDGDEDPRASPAALAFANIRHSDYRASHAYISSHPEILQESETDGLLMAAFNTAVENRDGVSAWQYVHQALLLQYCRMLGRDGVTIFFKRIATPGHQAREVFEKDVTERFQRIQELAEKQRAPQRSEGVEQIQIQAIEPGTAIQIQIPEADSEDEEMQKARAIFEAFPSEMKVALESGSINKVNEVLGAMDVVEAENLVGLLGDAGCLNIEKEVIDATTEEGEKRFKHIQESATANAEDT